MKKRKRIVQLAEWREIQGSDEEEKILMEWSWKFGMLLLLFYYYYYYYVLLFQSLLLHR